MSNDVVTGAELAPQVGFHSGYDEQIRLRIGGYEALHEASAAVMAAEIGERARACILVVGAGTGEEVIRLGTANPEWMFTAVDPSAEMLADARRRIAEAGLSDRVEFQHGATDELPEDQPYDGATLLLVQHFLPDGGPKLELLRSIADRLRPGAPLVLADMHGTPGSPEFRRLFGAWGHRLATLGMPDEEIDAMLGGLPEVIQFVPASRIEGLLDEAGFGEVMAFFQMLVVGGWVARKR